MMEKKASALNLHKVQILELISGQFCALDPDDYLKTGK